MARQKQPAKVKAASRVNLSESVEDKRVEAVLARMKHLKYWPEVNGMDYQREHRALGYGHLWSTSRVYTEIKKFVMRAKRKVAREKDAARAEQLEAARKAAQ